MLFDCVSLDMHISKDENNLNCHVIKLTVKYTVPWQAFLDETLPRFITTRLIHVIKCVEIQ